jgi:hypothetical protein
MPLQPRTIPSHASEPIERGLIATTIDHRPEQRHGRPPTIPIIGTGSRMVIRAYRKPSDHPTIANVSGSAVHDSRPHRLRFFPEKICYARFVQLRGLNHGAVRTRSWVAAEILMLTYLPPATCGVVCTSMTLPLNDPGSAAPAICRHTATGMITDIIL